MGTLLYNVLMSGLNDGLSVTMISTVAMVLALYILSWRRNFNLNWFLGVLIVATMLFGFLAHLYAVDFGNPGRIYTLLDWLYAGFFLISGIVILWDWLRARTRKSMESLVLGSLSEGNKKEISGWFAQGLSAVILIAALTVTVQDMRVPMAPYMIAITNNIYANILPWLCIFSLFLYTILKFWLVWTVIFLFSWTRMSQQIKLMIVAAFFLAAGVKLFI